jgi:hypothetical protein
MHRLPLLNRLIGGVGVWLALNYGKLIRGVPNQKEIEQHWVPKWVLQKNQTQKIPNNLMIVLGIFKN